MARSPMTAPELVAQARAGVEEIDAAELQRRVAAGAALIDVREPAEFAEGHIAAAVNIPRGVLEFQVEAHPALACATAPELALRERPLLIYCRTGGRAALAAESLQRMGFGAVASLAGGILAWQADGRALAGGG